MGETLPGGESDDLAVSWPELSERVAQLGGPSQIRRIRANIAGDPTEEREQCPPAAVAARLVGEHTTGGGDQPGQGIPDRGLVKPSPGDQERLGDDVIGRLGTPPTGIPEHHPVMGVPQLVEARAALLV